MFKEHNIDDVVQVTNDLIELLSTKHVAKSRESLRLYVDKAKGNKRKVLDIILSVLIQSNYKAPVCRYNLIPASDEYLELLDVLVLNFNSTQFYKLPFVLQKTIHLMSDESMYRTSITNLRKMIKEYHYIPQYKDENTKCKRCYTVLQEADELCCNCKVLIEDSAKFFVESFETVGTTVEAFNYKFLDWEVQVNKTGEYKFIRLDKSTTRYQPSLPIKEYTNLSKLIG